MPLVLVLHLLSGLLLHTPTPGFDDGSVITSVSRCSVALLGCRVQERARTVGGHYKLRYHVCFGAPRRQLRRPACCRMNRVLESILVHHTVSRPLPLIDSQARTWRVQNGPDSLGQLQLATFYSGVCFGFFFCFGCMVLQFWSSSRAQSHPNRERGVLLLPGYARTRNTSQVHSGKDLTHYSTFGPF